MHFRNSARLISEGKSAFPHRRAQKAEVQEATRAEQAGRHRRTQAGMAGEGPTTAAEWLDGSLLLLLLRWPSSLGGELRTAWDAVRAAAVAPALATASGACLAMLAMLLADAVFMAAASLARRRPERRYRAGPLGSGGNAEEDDEEGGRLGYPMVLVQIPMYNEREVRIYCIIAYAIQ